MSDVRRIPVSTGTQLKPRSRRNLTRIIVREVPKLPRAFGWRGIIAWAIATGVGLVLGAFMTVGVLGTLRWIPSPSASSILYVGFATAIIGLGLGICQSLVLRVYVVRKTRLWVPITCAGWLAAGILDGYLEANFGSDVYGSIMREVGWDVAKGAILGALAGLFQLVALHRWGIKGAAWWPATSLVVWGVSLGVLSYIFRSSRQSDALWLCSIIALGLVLAGVLSGLALQLILERIRRDYSVKSTGVNAAVTQVAASLMGLRNTIKPRHLLMLIIIPVAAVAVILLQLARSGKPLDAVHVLRPLPGSPVAKVSEQPITGQEVALPTVAPGAPVRFVRDAEGYRLYVDHGVVYYGEQTTTLGGWDAWIGPSRLLLTWLSVPFDGERIHEAYVLNLENGMLESLPGYKVHMTAYAWKDGLRVALLDLGGDEYHPRILLSDVASGEVTTIYDSDPSVAQWAGMEMHPQPGDFSFKSGNATWISRDAFVVEMSPGFARPDPPNVNFWGDSLLIVDISTKSTHLLPRGFLEGALYDGTILLSQDSEDGTDLYAFQPAYTAAPTLLSDPGVWLSSIEVSPDGSRVLWLESDPGAENLARQHEICFEGCGIRARPKAIVVWESETGQLKRTSLNRHGWGRDGLGKYGAYAHWSIDNTSILFQTLISESDVRLYRLREDGSVDLLLSQPGGPMMTTGPGDYVTGIGLVGEGNDGSIYYVPPTEIDNLLLRKPDGTTEVLTQPVSGENRSSGFFPYRWTLDRWGRLLILHDDGVTIRNVATGQQNKVAFPAKEALAEVHDPLRNVEVSPDGKWLAYAGWDRNQFFSLGALGDPRLALRIVPTR